MGKVIVKWLLTSVLVVLVVSALTFILASLVPGDAARTILGPDAMPEQVELLRKELGLTRPLPVQYWEWLSHVVQGDFGRSISSRALVGPAMAARFEVTISLLICSIITTTALGIGLGVLSAVKGGWAGRVVDVLSLIGFAVPGYWLGLVLVAIFAVKIPVFPATGYVSFAHSVPGWIAGLFLPVVTMAITGCGVLAKQTRSGLLDELDREYVRMLRGRGIPERMVLLHALRNAAGPLITIIGLMFIGLVGGAVLVETVFVLPGLGSMIVEATKGHDIPVILGVTFILSIVVVVVNLLVELSYAALNPKVRA